MSDRALPSLAPILRRTVAAAFVAFILCCLTGAAAARASCPYSAATVRSVSLGVLRRAVLCLVNQQRSGRHLRTLTLSSRLSRSAQGWTTAMVTHDFFGHGSDFAARITAVGYKWSAAGENIATGFATPASVMTAWMNSPDHRANILNPAYTNIGVGENPRPVRGYGSRGGTWTQDFGAAR
jgi:uncharacterized protein YkwD